MALVFEFLIELTKPKIGDLFPPQAFHAFKVQVFKEQNIELATQVYCEFPMVIGSLIRRFLMETRNGLTFSLLVVRPFHLAGIYLLSGCQLIGILF